MYWSQIEGRPLGHQGNGAGECGSRGQLNLPAQGYCPWGSCWSKAPPPHDPLCWDKVKERSSGQRTSETDSVIQDKMKAIRQQPYFNLFVFSRVDWHISQTALTFVLFSSRSRARHVGQDWHRKESCICTDDHDVHLVPFWYPDQIWTIGKLRGGGHGSLPNRNEYRRYWYPSGIWRFLLRPIGC